MGGGWVGVRFLYGLRAQRRALQENRLGPKKQLLPLIYNRSDKDGDSVDKKTWHPQTRREPMSEGVRHQQPSDTARRAV